MQKEPVWYNMKIKKIKSKSTLLVFLVVGLVFFVVDTVRVKMEQNPVFSIPMAFYKDGGSVDYVGLFYTVKKQVVDFEMALMDEKGGFQYQLAPWLLPRVVLAQSNPTQNLNIRLNLEQDKIGCNQSDSSLTGGGPTSWITKSYIGGHQLDTISKLNR